MPTPDAPECHRCNETVTKAAIKCHNCEAWQLRTVLAHVLAQDDSFIAVLLAIVLPGLGHAYLGISRRGATFTLLTGIALVVPIFGLPVAILIWAVSVYDVLDRTA